MFVACTVVLLLVLWFVRWCDHYHCGLYIDVALKRYRLLVTHSPTEPAPLHPYNTVKTSNPIDYDVPRSDGADYSVPRSNVTISKSSMSANSPGDGKASPYLYPVKRQSEYETPVSMHEYSEPLIALSEIEPEYHEYQDIEHSVTKESLPPVSPYLTACPVCTYLHEYICTYICGCCHITFCQYDSVLLLVPHEMYWLCGNT